MPISSLYSPPWKRLPFTSESRKKNGWMSLTRRKRENILKRDILLPDPCSLKYRLPLSSQNPSRDALLSLPCLKRQKTESQGKPAHTSIWDRSTKYLHMRIPARPALQRCTGIYEYEMSAGSATPHPYGIYVPDMGSKVYLFSGKGEETYDCTQTMRVPV